MSERSQDQQLLDKALKFCDYQERTEAEVRSKLARLKAGRDKQEAIINQLRDLGYLNEERYARSFARSKFRYNKWGRIKIRMHLLRKGLSEDLIDAGMEEIDEEAYYSSALTIAEHRKRQLKGEGEPDYQEKQKIGRYLMQRGYESELIREILDKL